VAVLLFIIVNIINPRRTVYDKTYPAFVPTPNTEKAAVLLDENHEFELKGWSNVRVSITASNLDNDWLEVEGDLINKDTDEIQPFAMELGYFHGIDAGESWTEDNRHDSVYLSSPPSGKYLLRLEAIGDRDRSIQTGAPFVPFPRPGAQGGQSGPGPVTLHVKIEQGVPRYWLWILTCILISIVPACVVVYHIWFEKRRWYGSSIGGE